MIIIFINDDDDGDDDDGYGDFSCFHICVYIHFLFDTHTKMREHSFHTLLI